MLGSAAATTAAAFAALLARPDFVPAAEAAEAGWAARALGLLLPAMRESTMLATAMAAMMITDTAKPKSVRQSEYLRPAM